MNEDDKNRRAVSLTANARAVRCVTAVLALLFVVPAFAQDVSPFQDLDRYASGYAYPGSQLKDLEWMGDFHVHRVRADAFLRFERH